MSIKIRRISRAEVEDLHHVSLENGGWKVVRKNLYTVEDAVNRINFLLGKALRFNSNLSEFQAVNRVGKDPIDEEKNFLIGYLMTNEERLSVGVYDALREAILIALLFGLYESKELAVNPLQLMQG